VRWYRGPDGDRRMWFARDEIEAIVDDELNRAGLVPSSVRPVVDVERFVEQHLRAELDQYAALDADVLGLTEFVSGMSPRISISEDLTGAALDDEDVSLSLVGRWRATVAHEGAHVLLHSVLFQVDDGQADLFGGDGGESAADAHGLMRCLKRDVGHSVQASDWREVQANRGMAALLMPRRLFREIADEAMSSLGISTTTAGSPDASVLAREMAECFTVSRQAAKIRLATLGLVAPSGSARLRAT
jgi:IrrE N-terminal-like domain